jgi:hypothetical protein
MHPTRGEMSEDVGIPVNEVGAVLSC